MNRVDRWIALAEDEFSGYGFTDLVKSKIVMADGRFMPVITYPPITLYPPADPETIFLNDRDAPGIDNTAYVHIPFCAAKCHYCHWIKKIAPTVDEIDEYLAVLRMEMALAVARLGGRPLPISSALFGGGTPTYLDPRRLEKVLTDFTDHFDLKNCRQFSFEAEPQSILGDGGFEKLKILKDFGVNRISMGVQSFDDDVLVRMGRLHKGSDALDAIRQIRKAGIESISIDLIYGYPGQSFGDWVRTMETAIASGADAWHLYRLRILRHGDMQGNILKQYEQSPELFPEVEKIYFMKAMGQVMSEESGFNQHFSRIFSTSQKHVTQFMWDYCCRLTNVVGMGVSSWSNHHRTFTQNIAEDFNKYFEMVRAGRLPVDRGLFRDIETEARRSLISPLKNDRVYKSKFQARTGLSVDEHFGPELKRLEDFGLARQNEKTVCLTPAGRFFADESVTQLFQKKYLPFPDLAHSLMPD